MDASANAKPAAVGVLARAAVWGTLLATLSFGCNPLQSVAYFLHKDDVRPAPYPLAPHLDAKGKEKEELKLVVFCDAPGHPAEQFAGADRELEALVTRHFPEVLKANDSKAKVSFVSTAQVKSFRASHRGWKTMQPREIGRSLGADYVVWITLTGLQMYEPNSAMQLYRGRAEANVDVYDTTVKGNEPRHSYTHNHLYPKTGLRDTTAPATQFKTEFMDSLANELILKHVDHKQSIGIAED